MAWTYNSITPVINESVSAVTLTPSVPLGTKVTVNGNDYVYCYNNGNFQISQGQFGTVVNLGSMGSGFSVTVSNAAAQVGDMLVVGVQAHATMATASYGWLCTRGVISVTPDTNAVSWASGDRLGVGIDGGFVTLGVSFSTGFCVGVALASGVTGYTSTNKVIFKSPLFG